MIGQQSDRIDQLESELNEERDTRKKQLAQSRWRLHDTEERLESVEEGSLPLNSYHNTEEMPLTSLKIL